VFAFLQPPQHRGTEDHTFLQPKVLYFADAADYALHIGFLSRSPATSETEQRVANTFRLALALRSTISLKVGRETRERDNLDFRTKPQTLGRTWAGRGPPRADERLPSTTDKSESPLQPTLSGKRPPGRAVA